MAALKRSCLSCSSHGAGRSRVCLIQYSAVLVLMRCHVVESCRGYGQHRRRVLDHDDLPVGTEANRR